LRWKYKTVGSTSSQQLVIHFLLGREQLLTVEALLTLAFMHVEVKESGFSFGHPVQRVGKYARELDDRFLGEAGCKGRLDRAQRCNVLFV